MYKLLGWVILPLQRLDVFRLMLAKKKLVILDVYKCSDRSKSWGLMQELGKVKGERSPPIYWRLSHQSRNSHTQQATKPTPSNN